MCAIQTCAYVDAYSSLRASVFGMLSRNEPTALSLVTHIPLKSALFTQGKSSFRYTTGLLYAFEAALSSLGFDIARVFVTHMALRLTNKQMCANCQLLRLDKHELDLASE
jgi:hypothetical protein